MKRKEGNEEVGETRKLNERRMKGLKGGERKERRRWERKFQGK